MKIETAVQYKCDRCGTVHGVGGSWAEMNHGVADGASIGVLGMRVDDLCEKCTAELEVLANNAFRPTRKRKEKSA